MNYLKKFVTEPRYPLILFGCITFIIWIFGKFYQPVLSQAQVYSGESISSNSIGQLVVSEGIVIRTYATGTNRERREPRHGTISIKPST